MKIKNILSSVLAVALSLTSVASVFAYTAPESVKVVVTNSQYSDEDVAGFGIELPEGTGYYNLDFKISELGDVTRTVTKSGRNDVVSGWGIVKVEMKCVAPDGKTLSLDYDNSTAPSTAGNANASDYNGVQLYYNGASVDGFLPTTAGTITELSDGFFNVDVIASLGATITISPSLTYQEFANNAATGELQAVVCDPITVTLPGGSTPDPVGPTVTEGDTANGITEYTFANSTAMDGQKILMTEAAKTGSTITAKTRFKVTYEGQSPRYFGSDIWEKLAQGEGSISVGSVKFGLIVDEDEDASKFTFEIVEI